MIEQPPQSQRGMSPWALAAMVLGAAWLAFAHMKGFRLWPLSAVVIAGELALALLVVVAGGGLAWPIVRRLAPDDAPRGLVVITAAAGGLWLLSTAVLVVGSAVDGALSPWLWWPVVIAGVGLSAWWVRKPFLAWRPSPRPDGRSLIWVIIAAAVAIANSAGRDAQTRHPIEGPPMLRSKYVQFSCVFRLHNPIPTIRWVQGAAWRLASRSAEGYGNPYQETGCAFPSKGASPGGREMDNIAAWPPRRPGPSRR